MMRSDLDDIPTTALVRQFSRQTGGHAAEKGSAKPGMLKHVDGSLLKPVISSPRGPRELAFYEEVFASKTSDETISTLRKFLPEFRGVFKMDNKDSDYLRLEDITEQFALPCIMDVKMGSRTYDHEASESKIKRECEKYKGTKHKCGFSIPGIKVYDIKSNMYITLGKDYGKGLNETTVRDGKVSINCIARAHHRSALNCYLSALRLFLNGEAGMDACIIREFLQKLGNVQEWFMSQTKYEFYASSLLLVYDAKHANKQNMKEATTVTSGTSVQEKCFANECERIKVPAESPKDDVTDVRMIDFAHVFPSSKTDDNYLHGLKNLTSIFQDLLQEAQKVENG